MSRDGAEREEDRAEEEETEGIGKEGEDEKERGEGVRGLDEINDSVQRHWVSRCARH